MECPTHFAPDGINIFYVHKYAAYVCYPLIYNATGGGEQKKKYLRKTYKLVEIESSHLR